MGGELGGGVGEGKGRGGREGRQGGVWFKLSCEGKEKGGKLRCLLLGRKMCLYM
jgi:hypothetical protein